MVVGFHGPRERQRIGSLRVTGTAVYGLGEADPCFAWRIPCSKGMSRPIRAIACRRSSVEHAHALNDAGVCRARPTDADDRASHHRVNSGEPSRCRSTTIGIYLARGTNSGWEGRRLRTRGPAACGRPAVRRPVVTKCRKQELRSVKRPRAGKSDAHYIDASLECGSRFSFATGRPLAHLCGHTNQGCQQAQDQQ